MTKKQSVDIEDCETFMEYVSIVALVPFAVPPATFAEAIITGTNAKKPMFRKEYFVTNDKKPSERQIMSFLQQLQ